MIKKLNPSKLPCDEDIYYNQTKHRGQGVKSSNAERLKVIAV